MPGAISSTITGIALALLYEKSRSTRVTMVASGVFVLFNFVAFRLLPQR